MFFLTRIFISIIFVSVILNTGCEKSMVDLDEPENFVKFIGESEELRGISFVELQNENLLILAERIIEGNITLNPFGNPDERLDEKNLVLVEVDRFGNLVSIEDSPYSAQHLELRKDDRDEIILIGLANEAFFFIYNWEVKKTLSIIEIPRELFLKINSNSTIKFYPKSKKILFNYYNWNNENETEDMILVLMDFSSNYKTFTFPHKRISEEVFMDWKWDPDVGKCKGSASEDCQSSQRWREFINDVYLSFFEYTPDGNVLVVYDSIRYGFFNRVSARTGKVWEENYKTLKITNIDQNGTVLESFLLPTSLNLRTFLVPSEDNYLICAAPVQYSWEQSRERYLDESYGLKELFLRYEHQLHEFNHNLDFQNSYTLELDDISYVNEFHSMKMTHDGEIIFLFKNNLEEDTNVKLIVIEDGNVKINFEYGSFTQNEYCVDVIKTISGGYIFLADIELDGHSQMALIRLDENGEITF
jgi:hypothetical protein